MSDLAMKLDHLKNAWVLLSEGVANLDSNDDLIRDGVIQRFGITFELAWITLKTFLEENGFQNIESPKTALREAYTAGIIDAESLWLDMLLDLDITSHMYNRQVAIEVCTNIQERYLQALHELIDEIITRLCLAGKPM